MTLVSEGVRTSVMVGGVEILTTPKAKVAGAEVSVVAQATSPTLPISFFNTHPGGGGNSGGACSPRIPGLVLFGTDTSGIRWSLDGIRTSRMSSAGLEGGISQKQSDGHDFCQTRDVAFFSTGSNTANKGGVYMITDLDKPWKVGKPVRVDGVFAGSPKLLFNGGGNNDARMGPAPDYSRHYGNILKVVDVGNLTFVHVSTFDGFHRITIDFSGATPVVTDQRQYAGTAGMLGRSLRMVRHDSYMSGNRSDVIILSLYDVSAGGTPGKPLLCVNANDTTGATLATAEIAALPTNIENIGYWGSTASGTVPLTVFVGNGYVGFSTNAFTTTGANVAAKAAAITVTNVSRTTAQNDGPENNEIWMAVGGDTNGANNIIIVGTNNGGKTVTQPGSTPNTFRTAWRGVVSRTSTTPATAVTWTSLDGPTHWLELVNGDPSLPWYLAGVNTPGLSGTSTMSHVWCDPLNRGRFFATCKGGTYRSDDWGLAWYITNGFGSADHNCFKFDAGSHPKSIGTTCGDWPFVVCTPDFGRPYVAKQALASITANSYSTRGVWSDPLTGDWFFGGYYNSAGAGHSVPDSSPANTVYSLSEADAHFSQDAVVSPTDNHLTALTDLKFTATAAGVIDGVCLYPLGVTTTANRVHVIATTGGGLFYTKNSLAATPTYTQLTSTAGAAAALQPFRSLWQGDGLSVQLDKVRAKAYFFDRASSSVWRCDVSALGIVTTTPIFYATGVVPVSRDSTCYLAHDRVNNLLWVSTSNNVWSIPSPDTAPAITTAIGTSNAVASAFTTYYSGELAGPIAYSHRHKALYVSTLGYSDGNGTTPYPRNGTDGPRAMLVFSPDVASQWGTDVTYDLATRVDRGYKLGYYLPKTIAIDEAGLTIVTGQQGSGGGGWYLPDLPMTPLSDVFEGSSLSPRKWPSTAGAPAVVGKRLRLTTTSIGSLASTASVFDLRDTPVSVGLATLPAAGAGGTKTEFWVKAKVAAKQLRFSVAGDLSGITTTGSGFLDQRTIMPAANYRYLRYRISGTTVLWEISPNRSIWTVLRSETVPSWLVGERLYATLTTSYTGTETAPGYAEFDRFNY